LLKKTVSRTVWAKSGKPLPPPPSAGMLADGRRHRPPFSVVGPATIAIVGMLAWGRRLHVILFDVSRTGILFVKNSIS
jgi:hypothetical protein